MRAVSWKTPMEVGSRLRAAREQRGVTLRDIANVTKISMTALRAIDGNDLARLPGGIFTRAYLRAYAAEVGLDPEQVVSEYVAQYKVVDEPFELPHVADDTRVRLPGSLAVVVFGLGLVIYSSHVFQGSTELSSESLAVDAVPALDESDVPKELAFAATSAPAAIDVRGVQVEIRPRGVCWISARADGLLVIYRLMEPGERAVVEAHDAIVLRVGDAGSFEYRINGQPGRPLGRLGEAVTVRITEDNYRAFFRDTASISRAGERAVRARQQRNKEKTPERFRAGDPRNEDARHWAGAS